MVTPLLRLPGDGCRYFVRGRCLYEECVNPGLRPEFSCAVLTLLEERFDAFVIRGERFGLTCEEAGRIWERRWAGPLSADWDCADFLPQPEDADEAGCGNLLDGICLPRLPVCPGRCRRYAGPVKESDSRSDV
jgi:hypothetical protein